MAALARYLGLAFAAADCLFEIDGSGRIVFAIGSDGGGGAGDRRLIGRLLAELVEAADGSTIKVLIEALRPGQRLGPTRVRLLMDEGGSRLADLSIFSIPELAPHVSCALSYVGGAAGETPLAEAAQLDAGTFRDQVRDQLAVAASRGRELSLALVEIKGLIDARQKLSSAGMAALLRKIQAMIAQHAPEAALAELSHERFAILHDAGEPAALVQALAGLVGPPGRKLEVAGQSVKLSPRRDPLQQFRAVRTALDCFLNTGLPRDEASLQRSFQAVLDETARSAGRLGAILQERRFELYYQPVVQLSTGLTSHHEVLVRFDKGVGPAPLIKLAEDLALIERLDALVAEQAVRRLRAAGSERLKLAINVSGGSLMNDAYLEQLLATTNSGLRQRLHLEITESAALQDLNAASRRIRGLRDAGFLVAIDDFGAGAASFDYLRALPVTSVKIDGRYVRGVDRDERAQTIIKHLVGLCSELEYVTVAEMVEREEELATITALGVDCGQGWAFGRPEPEPCEPARRPAARARRVGEREMWS